MTDTMPAPPRVEPPAATTPKEVPPPIAAQWAAAFDRGDLDALMSLYDDEALLWGTSSSTLRRGTVQIRQYYAQILKAFPGTRIALGEATPRIYGETGVSSGSYTVRRVAGDGKARVTSRALHHDLREAREQMADRRSPLVARGALTRS